MDVLLIGGGGFIGVWLTKALVEAGHSVRMTGRSGLSNEKGTFLPETGWEFRQMDFRKTIRRPDMLKKADAIVPLPWLLGSAASDAAPIGSLGSAMDILSLLCALVRLDPKPLVVFPSSHLAPKPQCLYAIHKMLVENYLRYFQRVHSIPYIALRTGKAYGPLQRRGVIWLYINRAMVGEPLPIYGEGKDRIAFTYVSDVARGFKWAIEGKFPRNAVYNLVGHNNTLTQVAEAVTKEAGGMIKHVPWPVLDRLLDPGDLPLGNDLARWGWEPEFGLKIGIDRTMEWVRGLPA